MDKWELRSIGPTDLRLNTSSDPFKEYHTLGYEMYDEHSMILDQGIDTPEIRYYTKLVRTQVNCSEYINSQMERRCLFTFLDCITRKPRSFMVPLILDVEYSTNPHVMLSVTRMFTETGYDIEIYWNLMPNTALMFNAEDQNPLPDNLLSVEKMYVSSCPSSFGGFAKHYTYHRDRNWIYDCDYKRKERTSSICLVQ